MKHNLFRHKKIQSYLRHHSKLEVWVTVIGSVEPIASLPIIIKIYTAQSASEHSLFSWSFFLLSSISWTIYGLKIKSMPVIVAGALWSAVYIPVIVGIIIYS